MTYGCEHRARNMHSAAGAAVSHSAELVRGEFHFLPLNTPSSGPSDHLLPKGRRATSPTFEISQRSPGGV